MYNVPNQYSPVFENSKTCSWTTNFRIESNPLLRRVIADSRTLGTIWRRCRSHSAESESRIEVFITLRLLGDTRKKLIRGAEQATTMP